MPLHVTIPLLIIFVPLSTAWKAVPANQAAYALRQEEEVALDAGHYPQGMDYAPRDALHSVYKFGWCKPELLKPVFLKKNVTLHFMNYYEARVKYIYLLDFKHTRNYAQQCIVMKFFVPKGFLFRKSRLPMYYCQGHVHYLIMNTVQKLQIHEFYIVICAGVWCVIRDLSECHDDYSLKPADGILKDHTFSWLGFVQYIHVTTGLPHHSKAPRVTLIQRQFAIGTATDLLNLPKNYRLGNVVFGDYERDEEDCDLTKSQIKMGLRCSRAYIEMPLVDITPHPEFSRFGVGNSLALVKFVRPMKSYYMIPICMPTLRERESQKKRKIVFLVDYISPVPRDFDTEKLGKKTLKLFTHRECRKHRLRSRLGSEGVTHVLCSSGCGVRSGAPIATHAADGAFELIGVSVGGVTCTRRSMRRRLNKEPPIFIDVFPYSTWIINVVTAFLLPHPYPHNFQLMDVNSGSGMAVNSKNYLRKRKRQKAGWRARTYVSGNWCYKTDKKQKKLSFFYTEQFQVNADPPAKLNLIMKISAGAECTISCVRMGLPNRLSEPVIRGVGGYNITIEMYTEWFPYIFYFTLILSGKNTSRSDFYEWIHERIPGFI